MQKGVQVAIKSELKSEVESGQQAFRRMDLALEERVQALLDALSVEEKISMMASRQPAIKRLDIPEFHIGGEAAHGLMSADGHTTVFPQTFGLACTWDTDLMQRIGTAVSDEARAYYHMRRELGGLCLWAPTIDMERDPRWGRTEEGYGEDPLLAGRMAGAYIKGMQGDHPYYLKTVPTPKHFYANNNEENRGSCSASLDVRNRREYYLRPFEIAVVEYGVQSIMAAYNAINGVPAMAHNDLNAIVKDEWGMKGFVVCDGGGLTQLKDLHGFVDSHAEAAAVSLKAGTDSFSDDALKICPIIQEAWDQGLISEVDLDRALANVFHVRFRLAHFDPPGSDPYADISSSVIACPEHRRLSAEAARKSIVLLKNDAAEGDDKPLLPLDQTKVHRIALVGPLADIVYRDWYTGSSRYATTILQALVERVGPESVLYSRASDIISFSEPDGAYFGSVGWYDGRLSVNRPDWQQGEQFERTDFGWGNQTLRSLSSGMYVSVQDSAVLSATEKEVYAWEVRSRFDLRAVSENRFEIYDYRGRPVLLDDDGVLAASDDPDRKAMQLEVHLHSEGIKQAAALAEQADVVIACVGNNPVLVAKEEFDRPDICLPPDQQKLLERMLQVNPRTAALIVSSYPYALHGLEAELPAILYMSHSGPELGPAVVETLFGDNSPAGRLPMTWYESLDQLPPKMDYDIIRSPRTYQYINHNPSYPFGHGLSYSSFCYDSMEIDSEELRDNSCLNMRVRVRNAGNRTAEEVVQVYGSSQGSALKRPQKQLLGFARIHLAAGEVHEQEFTVSARQFMLRDPLRDSWFLENGSWIISAGGSSLDLPLQQEIRVLGEDFQRPGPGEEFSAAGFVDCASIEIRTDSEGQLYIQPGLYPAEEQGESWIAFPLPDMHSEKIILRLQIMEESAGQLLLSVDDSKETVGGITIARPLSAASPFTIEIDPAVVGDNGLLKIRLSGSIRISTCSFRAP